MTDADVAGAHICILPASYTHLSLLAAYGGDGGHLTDEHFKHMAEVSGTNIRELESFCERCAGEAGDREREGGELTFDDIDAIASQYFDTSAKKINVQTVQSVIEEQYGVTHEELIGPRRNANIAKARHIAIYLAIEMCEMTTTDVYKRQHPESAHPRHPHTHR